MIIVKAALSAYSDVEDGLAGVEQTAAQEKAQWKPCVPRKSPMTAACGSSMAVSSIYKLYLLTNAGLFSVQDELIQVKLSHLEALVGLYRVLGGGWQKQMGVYTGAHTKTEANLRR